jgi:hypothetical protein
VERSAKASLFAAAVLILAGGCALIVGNVDGTKVFSGPDASADVGARRHDAGGHDARSGRDAGTDGGRDTATDGGEDAGRSHDAAAGDAGNLLSPFLPGQGCGHYWNAVNATVTLTTDPDSGIAACDVCPDNIDNAAGLDPATTITAPSAGFYAASVQMRAANEAGASCTVVVALVSTLADAGCSSGATQALGGASASCNTAEPLAAGAVDYTFYIENCPAGACVLIENPQVLLQPN